MTSTASEYREKRRQAIIQAFALPLMVGMLNLMMDTILGDMAEDPAFEPMMATLMNLAHVMVVVGFIGCTLVAIRYHMLAMQVSTSGRSRRSTSASDSDDEEAPSLGDILADINAVLPDLTFGTYRTVESVDVPTGMDCAVCGEDATTAREYYDSTVRFGVAFGKTDAKTVAYCDACVDTDDAICEGWVSE